MALFAEDIPESYRTPGKGKISQLEFFDAIGDFGVLDARLAESLCAG